MTAGTIAGLLDESAAIRPGRPMLRDDAGRTLTVGDVANLTAAATHWLWDAGVRPGMTVAWQLPSHLDAAVLMLALARTDVRQAPVLHLYRRREVCSAVDVAEADILVVDRTMAANAGAERMSARCQTISSNGCARCRGHRSPSWTARGRPMTSGGCSSRRAPPAGPRACATRTRRC
jgi:acyl-CoA synthetase (AMP-forming)/AMP-acid ligase II